MACDYIQVPISFLLNKQITYADKRVWMGLTLNQVNQAGRKQASFTKLARRIHISRPTIYNSLVRLNASGWCKDNRPILFNRYTACIPANLISSAELKARDVVVYGLLQAEPFFWLLNGNLSYRALGRFAGLNVRTVRQAVLALARAGWIKISQLNQRAPIDFELADPRDAYQCEIDRRIHTSKNKAEAIARETVVFLLEPADFEVTAKHSWLTNRKTGALMELDLYIPDHNIAMEYQGEQHFGETEFATAEDVAKQQERDAEKVGILTRRRIKQLWLTIDDLSIEKIRGKLIALKAPLRDLEGFESIQEYLDDLGRKYQETAAYYIAQREAQKLAEEQAKAAAVGQAQATEQ